MNSTTLGRCTAYKHVYEKGTNFRTMGEYQLKSNEPAYFIIVSHKVLGWPLFSFASVLKDGK